MLNKEWRLRDFLTITSDLLLNIEQVRIF